MNVTIHEYVAKDSTKIVELLDELQRHIAAVDTLKRNRCLPGHGVAFFRLLIDKIEKNKGKIFIAKQNGKIAGFIAGILQQQSKEDLFECIPTKVGRILELFVRPECRTQGIGQGLMNKVEEYFKEQKCDVVRVEVFVPNKVAHSFYKNAGYLNRMMDLMKVL